MMNPEYLTFEQCLKEKVRAKIYIDDLNKRMQEISLKEYGEE